MLSQRIPFVRTATRLAMLAVTAMAALPVPPAAAAENHALQLNGTNQYVTFGKAPTLGASTFTIETWFLRTGVGTATTTGPRGLAAAIPLLTKGRAQNDGSTKDLNYFLGIDANTGVLVADFEEGPGGSRLGLNHPIAGATGVTNGVWHHAAATYNGSAWALYLDGALERTLVVNRTPRADSIQHAGLGTALNSNGKALGFFRGVLDEARVWNVARTASDIAAAKDTEIAESAAGLVGRWGLNEGAGSSVGNSAGPVVGAAVQSPAWVDGAPLLSVPVNQPPAAPSVVGPLDGAVDVAAPPTLEVALSDPDEDPLDVTFYGRSLEGTAPPGDDFTLMIVPDPQKYTTTTTLSATYRAQMQWIVDTTDTLDTAFTMAVGDLVQNVDSATQWARADAAWDILDAAATPYTLLPGNHDMTAGGIATHYDSYFPPNRYEANPWYGGYLGDPTDGIADPANRLNKDNYALFTAGGADFLVLNLEMDLPLEAVQWAQGVIDAYPDRHVILATHRWLREDGTRWASTYYGHARPRLTPEQVWSQLVAPNCTVFMVVMGHEHTERRLTDLNTCGQPVFQLLANYQNRENGGDGWLRYYKFEPSQGEIEAYTYSVTRNGGAGEFETDADSRFTLAWTPDAAHPFVELGSASAVPSGSSTSFVWDGLDPGATYEWYAVASDGTLVATGPRASFTVAVAPAP
jgi:hypothetical protein